MGQKVNPNSFRLVINRDWQSKWHADNPRQEAKWIAEEDVLRKELKKDLKQFRVAKFVIIRKQEALITIDIHTADPGAIRGQEDKGLRILEAKVRKITGYKVAEVRVTRIESPATNAQLVAEGIAKQLEERVNHKMAQKRAINAAMGARAFGIKTKVSGRLGGNDMSRSEGYFKGTVPSQSLNKQVEYGFCEAVTQYGLIGVKVWICVDPNAKPMQRRPRFDNRRGNS